MNLNRPILIPTHWTISDTVCQMLFFLRTPAVVMKRALNAEVPALSAPRQTVPNFQNQLRMPCRSAIGISDWLDGRPEINRSRPRHIHSSAN